jgi:CBS domain-containing protein
MEPLKVCDVMTRQVVAVRERAGYQEIVEALAVHRVSAVPVLDAAYRVIGVVSEADLLAKIQFAEDSAPARLFEGRRRRTARTKASGDTAVELMSSPAVTIDPDASLVEAARLMEGERVKRLPVVHDDGRLAGIVARSDLLRGHLRPDAAIGRDVTVEVLGTTLGIGAPRVRVKVANGVVTLAGAVDRRSTAQIAVRLTRSVTGVVDVLDELTYDHDDTAGRRRHHVSDAEV